jgi:hypothetical protein
MTAAELDEYAREGKLPGRFTSVAEGATSGNGRSVAKDS